MSEGGRDALRDHCGFSGMRPLAASGGGHQLDLGRIESKLLRGFGIGLNPTVKMKIESPTQGRAAPQSSNLPVDVASWPPIMIRLGGPSDAIAFHL